MCVCVFAGAQAALHLPERTHPRAAHPRALDQTELGARGHHHQHHGVHPQAAGRSHGQCVCVCVCV